MNGLTRRTYTVRIQDGDDASPFGVKPARLDD